MQNQNTVQNPTQNLVQNQAQNPTQNLQSNVQQNPTQQNVIRQTAGQNIAQNPTQNLQSNVQQNPAQQNAVGQTAGQNIAQNPTQNQSLSRQNVVQPPVNQNNAQQNQALSRQNVAQNNLPQNQALNQQNVAQPLTNQNNALQATQTQPNQQQFNQSLSRPNQQTVGAQNVPQNQINQQQPLANQNNAGKALASRQSKLSAANILAANELPQPVLQQPPQQSMPRPIPGIQHNLQSRQSKMSILGAQQQPRVVTRPVIEKTGSRSSKLSIVNPVRNRNRIPEQAPTNKRASSRQSKLSIVDAEERPRQNIPRQLQSRVSNKSVPVRRPQQQPLSPLPNQNVAPNFQTRNRRLTPMSVGRVNTASTNQTTYSQYNTLDYFPLVVGREEPEIFTEGLQNEGWMSEPDAQYPIDVILGLDHIANVYKIYLSVVDHLSPSKIEISVGRKKKEDEEPTYETARSARFELKASMKFERRNTDVEEKETKVAFIDSECQYVWVLFYAPHPSRLNPTNQIRITDLTIEGYSIEPKRQRTSRSVDSFRDSVTLPRTRQQPRSRRRIPSRASTAFSDVSKISRVSKLSDAPSQLESRNGRVSRISSILGSGVSEGEGWKSNGENLATDPLMAVRLVKNLLRKKQKRAVKRGREVEATVCLRAVETLGGYERQMIDIRKKMSEAIQQGNTDEARKQELSLIDCRDTSFRVIHLDLLLEKAELRAIGVQSKYAEPIDLR